MLPRANLHAMNLHLQEISTQVSHGAFAVLTLDGAGWHQLGDRLVVPDNIGLLHLPPYSPELNPVETSGSSSDKMISATASTQPMKRSSTPVVSPGTSLSPCPRGSDPSPCATTPKRSAHESVSIKTAQNAAHAGATVMPTNCCLNLL